MWGYYWEFSIAQIELMAIDCPVVVYDYKNRKKKGKGEFAKANAADVNAKIKEWEGKYGNGNSEVKLDLKGFF